MAIDIRLATDQTLIQMAFDAQRQLDEIEAEFLNRVAAKKEKDNQ